MKIFAVPPCFSAEMRPRVPGNGGSRQDFVMHGFSCGLGRRERIIGPSPASHRWQTLWGRADVAFSFSVLTIIARAAAGCKPFACFFFSLWTGLYLLAYRREGIGQYLLAYRGGEIGLYLLAYRRERGSACACLPVGKGDRPVGLSPPPPSDWGNPVFSQYHITTDSMTVQDNR